MISVQNYFVKQKIKSKNNIFGIEINSAAAKIAKLNMILLGLDHNNITTSDSLKDLSLLKKELRTKKNLKPKNYFDLIITNPPFKMALSMAEHAQSIAKYKTALLLKITFLEGCARAKFFKQHPPKRVWVFSKRLSLLKDGQSYNGGMMCLAWFVWETGSTTAPQIGWL